MAELLTHKFHTYRRLIWILKAGIILSFFSYVINTIFIRFQVDNFLLSYLMGWALLSWIFILIAAIALRLGRHYLLCLAAPMVLNVIDVIDFEFGVPLSDSVYSSVEMVILGCFGVAALVCYRRYKYTDWGAVHTEINKILILWLKALPVVIAAGTAFRTFVSFFSELSESNVYSYLFGISMLHLIFMYAASYVFRFCSYHRVAIIYIFIQSTVCLIDWYYPIEPDVLDVLLVALVALSFIIFISLYVHVKNHQKIAQPVD